MLTRVENIIDKDPRDRIFLCQMETSLLFDLWIYQTEFAESFCIAAHEKYCHFGAEPYINSHVEHFIAVTKTYLLRTPSDLLPLIRNRLDNQCADAFLEDFVSNPLVPERLLVQMIRSNDILTTSDGCNNWLDRPLRTHAKNLLSLATKVYSHEDLIPCGITRNRFAAEYVLSWAFEENRLSNDGITFFEKHFPKKFRMLVGIKTRQGQP